MILPPGHNVETALRPARLGRRERIMVAGAAALAVLLVIGIVVAIASPGRGGRGCIDYGMPYSVGGQEIYRCGEAARSTCRGLSRSGYGPGTLASAEAACRKAGLPVA